MGFGDVNTRAGFRKENTGFGVSICQIEGEWKCRNSEIKNDLV